MLLSTALRIQPKEVVALVGGGGKTTTLFRLTDELVTQGKRVVVTTTTRMGAAQIEHTNMPYVRYAGGVECGVRVQAALAAAPAVIVIGDETDEDKVAGVPPELVGRLVALDGVDAVVIEADGAKGLPFKAPAGHEPVVPAATTLLVPVVGVSILGRPLIDGEVHRAALVAALVGAQVGDAITAEMVAFELGHPQGGGKTRPAGARTVVLVNKVESAEQLADARAIADRMLTDWPEIQGVAIGAVQNAAVPIRETARRVAAVVLAAGTGTRMGAQVKQLLPWRGRTLIENAVGVVQAARLNDIVVVLGARAEEIEPVLQGTRVRIVRNPDWAEGHSTSIRAGLRALAPEIDAILFVNADQPFLTPEIADQIVQRYRETDASIVAPRYAGKRGSPVLFRRTHLAELERLQGEEGGREVLQHHPVEYVDVTPADAGFDVDTPEDYECARQKLKA